VRQTLDDGELRAFSSTTALRGGFHNHGTGWKLLDGKRPIDLLTAGTPRDFAFQVDTATCLAAGGDPIAFVKAEKVGGVEYYLIEQEGSRFPPMETPSAAWRTSASRAPDRPRHDSCSWPAFDERPEVFSPFRTPRP
jgi:hypothetical protein